MSSHPSSPSRPARRLGRLAAALRCSSTVTSPQAAEPAEPSPTITRIRSIKTAPYGIRLVVVKVETDVPGLCEGTTRRSLGPAHPVLPSSGPAAPISP